MTPLEYAQLWRDEKDQLLYDFFYADSGSVVATAIKTLEHFQVHHGGRLVGPALPDVGLGVRATVRQSRTYRTRNNDLESALGLSPSQLLGLRHIFDLTLTDTMYTLLLGLDGCASIGGRQEIYSLRAENCEQLSGNGELEVAAYEVFQHLRQAEPLAVVVGGV